MTRATSQSGPGAGMRRAHRGQDCPITRAAWEGGAQRGAASRGMASTAPACRQRRPFWSCVSCPSVPENDVTAYIVVEDFGDLGRAFRETDLTEADFDTMVRNIISGEYRNPLRVVAFNTSRGVSEDIANAVLDRTYDTDATLNVGPRRFIDMHMTPGAKRPPAPSVLPERDHSARKKA
jgi:hypothetical protein